MAVQKVADLTMEELQRMIDESVKRHLRVLNPPRDTRTLQEILDSIDKHMYTPPPGTPSTLEMIREDRDS